MKSEYKASINRDIKIDIIKGICVFFIVLGHVNGVGNVELQKVIFSFHVPIFVVISGFMAKDYYEDGDNASFKNFIKKKARSLLLPYYIYVLIYSIYSLTSVFMGMIDWKHFVKMSIDRLIGLNAANIGPIWFVMALFSVQVMDWLIKRSTDRLYAHFAVGIVGVIWAMYCDGVYLPLLVKNACLLLPFLALGRMLKRREFFCSKYSWIISVVGVIVMFLSSRYNSIVYFYTCNLGNPFLFVIQSISGSIGLFGILYNALQKMTMIKWRLLPLAGKESLDIMAIHLYIHMPINIILLRVGMDFEGLLKDDIILIIIWSFILYVISIVLGCLGKRLLRKHSYYRRIRR